jgi:hypothetical protein
VAGLPRVEALLVDTEGEWHATEALRGATVIGPRG